jgi:hypothetical protein
MLIKKPYGIQRAIFFNNLNDFFADFFNLLHDISGQEIYSRHQGSYFPFSYLILYPFSLLDNFNDMNLEQMWGSKIGLISVFLFAFFSNILLFLSLERLRRKYSLPIYALIGLFLSNIFFYTIERGNLITLSSTGVCFYLCYFDSNNKKERIFAVVALAISVTLKIYPAIYGLLYFQKRQFKEIFLCILTTIGLIFLPFLFFKGGFSNIPLLFLNMKSITGAYEPDVILSSYKNFLYYILPRFSLQHIVYLLSENFINFFNKNDTNNFSSVIAEVSFLFVCFISLISVIYAILITNILKKITLLTLVLLFFPVPSYLYCGLYIFPIIIIYFSEFNNNPLKYNIFFLITIIVVLNPFQIGHLFNFHTEKYLFSVNYILSNIFLFILWQMLVFVCPGQLAKETVENEKRTILFVKLNSLLFFLLVVDIIVVFLVSIPQIYSFILSFLESIIFNRELNRRWYLSGSKAITIVGIALMIEITINLILLNNSYHRK